MPDMLFIRLKNNINSPMEWMLARINSEIEYISSYLDHTESLTTAINAASTIIVFTPSENILLTKLDLPRLSRSKLLQAIPYALEDILTEKSDTLHFAIGTRTRNQPVPIAVINKLKMEEWLSSILANIEDARNKIEAFIPDVIALPWQNNTCSILIDDNLSYVRFEKTAGFVIETESLHTALHLMLKQLPAPLEMIRIFHSPEPIFTAKQLTELAVPVKYEQSNQSVLSLLITGFQESLGTYRINLLQGEYSLTSQKTDILKLKLVALTLLVFWLLASTVTNIINYSLLTRELRVSTERLRSLYAEMYPGNIMPDDPPKAMRDDLNTLRTNSTDSVFFRLLTTIGPDISQLLKQSVKISSVQFTNRQLILDIIANDLAPLEPIRKSIESQGFKASLTNTERTSSGLIETRLTIEETS